MGCISVPFLAVYFLFLVTGCQNEKNVNQLPLPIIDSIEISADDIFRVYLTKIPDQRNEDSVLVIFSGNDSKIYYLDADLKHNQTILYTNVIGDEVFNMCYVSGLKKFVLMNISDNILYLIENDWSRVYKEYTLTDTDSFSMFPFTNFAFSELDTSVLLLKIPYLNIAKKEGHAKYFSGNILSKNKIEDDRVTSKLIEKIDFPEIYKLKFYNDNYIFTVTDERDNIYYVFRQWDSIGILSVNGVRDTYPIPEQFSVDTVSIPFEQMESRIYSDRYSSLITSNVSVLNLNDHLLLFQKLKNETYENEDGSLNDFINSKMRLILFNKKYKHFEDRYYLLPERSHPFKTIIFQNHLIILSQGENYGQIKLYKIDL